MTLQTPFSWIVALIASVCMVPFAAANEPEGDEPEVDAYYLFLAEVMDGAPPSSWTVKDAICVQVNNCPAGPLYEDDGAGGNNISGCSVGPGTTCVGVCDWCTGSFVAGSLCKAMKEEKCEITTNNALDCGNRATRTCTFATVPPLGQVPTTNSCYCTGTMTLPSGDCDVEQC